MRDKVPISLREMTGARLIAGITRDAGRTIEASVGTIAVRPKRWLVVV